METLSIKTDCNRIKWQERGQNLNCRSSSLIHNINLILELIIRNTLKYNKFTSAEEVFEYVLTLHGGNAFQNSDQELELVLDKEIIVSLCNSLCAHNGVLRKLEKNDESFYRLNYELNF